jgi:hypothetical protein
MVNKGRAREYAIQIIIPECQRICRMKNDEALDNNHHNKKPSNNTELTQVRKQTNLIWYTSCQTMVTER